MIYVIEIPRSQPAACWTTRNHTEFIEAVIERLQLTSPGSDLIVKTTPAKLIKEYGLDSVAEARSEEPWIAALHDEAGPDADLYQVGENEFQAQPISPFDACKAYLASNTERVMVMEGTEQAIALAIDPDAWTFTGAEQARQALKARIDALAAAN